MTIVKNHLNQPVVVAVEISSHYDFFSHFNHNSVVLSFCLFVVVLCGDCPLTRALVEVYSTSSISCLLLTRLLNVNQPDVVTAQILIQEQHRF